MFEIVSIFTRPDAEVDFFYSVQINHPTIKSLREQFINSQGSKDIVFKSKDAHRMEIAMIFDSKESFFEFVKNNKSLLVQRKELIDDWCARTGHTYDFYIIET